MFKQLKYLKSSTFLSYCLYVLSVRFDFNYKEKVRFEKYFYTIQNILFSNAIIKNFFLSEIFTVNYNVFKNNIGVQIRKESSDVEVFQQVIINHEYLPLLKRIIHRGDKSLTVVDCGANIGLSGIYFDFYFKQKTDLYLLEPFIENYNLIQQNLKLNSIQATVLNQALWTSNANLSLDNSFRDGKEWSITVEENPNGEIQGVSLQRLMSSQNISEIDILKIDIEGSEFPVFLDSQENRDCLKKVKTIFIEIHDDIGDRQKLYKIFSSYNFEIVEFGELTLFMNKNFVK